MCQKFLMVGFVLKAFSVILLSDFLPVDLFKKPKWKFIFKGVAVKVGLFSWGRYQLHILALGGLFLGLAKYIRGGMEVGLTCLTAKIKLVLKFTKA